VSTSDTSTSIVITADGAQIQPRETPVTTYNDIVYSMPASAGKTVEVKLDLQVPSAAGKKPVVVYVPGGGFINSGNSVAVEQRTYVAQQGFAVASIQYRTAANGATYQDSVADVKSAIRFLRANAGQYGIDAAKVAVWGQSAGGYLAAMTGTTNGLARFETGNNLDQSSRVDAVVDQFGPSDLSKIADDFDATMRQASIAPGNTAATFVFGPGTTKSITEDPAAVASANPATYADASDPPFLLFHGSADQMVSPSQTLLLHNALRAKGGRSTRYVLSGANHGDLAFMGNTRALLPWTTQEVMGKITTFLGKRLRDA
jgi:acetyl esterase/lipase